MSQFEIDWELRIDFERMRKQRLERAQRKLKEYQLDALISFRVENIRYITSYRPLWWPHGGAVTRNAAILPKEGVPYLFASSGDYHRALKGMPWIHPEHIKPLAVMEEPGIIRNIVEKFFVPILKELNVDKGRIGLDAGTFMFMEILREALPNAQFVDGYQAIVEAKMVKTTEEIKCMRLSAIMADVGMQTAISGLKVGVRECEVLGEAMHAMYSLGMEVPQCNLIVASGEHTAPLYRMASDKIINYGDLVLIDLGGCYAGYFSDFTRTVVVGEPTEIQKKIYKTVYEMMNQITTHLRPGITNAELNEKVSEVLKGTEFEKYGFYGVLGHSIGTGGLEPPLVGEPVATGEKVFKFEPGMTFSFEPGVFVDGVGGVRLENNILITETGNEVLNKTPYDKKLLS
jgi:Xaa-Pro aminopeptidase